MIGTRRSQRALASIAVLMVLTVVTIILTSILQRNATQRTALKLRQQSTEASLLADSGVAEALHRLAAAPSPGSLDRSIDKGAYHAAWQPAPGLPNTWDITSTGLSRTADPNAPRRAVKVRAVVEKGAARVTSWAPTSARN